ncbi:MAG: hypothetical protein HWE39_13970 [Oceanospirillaceae bacterium]|nr:hypothetical protein [Oceanospirillaceae bacterium]
MFRTWIGKWDVGAVHLISRVGRMRYKRFLLMLGLLAQFPVMTSAQDMEVCGNSVCIGDTIETLVKSAGRPHHVERRFECVGSPCEQMGILEQWTYLRDDTRYTVELFNDRVTSIKHETAL